MASKMDDYVTRYQAWYERLISEAEKKRSEGSGEVSNVETSNTQLREKLDLLMRRLQASTAMLIEDEGVSTYISDNHEQVVTALQDLMGSPLSSEEERWMVQGVAAMTVCQRRHLQSATSMLSTPQKTKPIEDQTSTPPTQQDATSLRRQ